MLWLRQDEYGRPATRFIIKAPRGGGKSRLLGAIGFVKWLLRTVRIVDMGGSLEQAQGVYNYFTSHINAIDGLEEQLPQEPTMKKTVSDRGNYFKAVAASPKQVRGQHPDELYIDEACEVKDELILAALPVVNSSKAPLIIMASTFHKIFGIFQETWDSADKLGYVRFSWDIFDVCLPFDPAIWDNPAFLEEVDDFGELKERAAGRTGDPDGWIPIENIVQAWREKASVDWFDVEYMGSRPSAIGMVNDPVDVDACTVNTFSSTFQRGVDVSLGIDWGFAGMTAVVAYFLGRDMKKHNILEKTYTKTRSVIIIKQVVDFVLEHEVRYVFADSSHPFENEDLQNALNKALVKKNWRCVVVMVSFNAEKETMLGNYRAHMQGHLLEIPVQHKVGIWQHKRYRYIEGQDRPMKKDDHIPDATMLCLKRWPLEKVVQELPSSNVDRTVQRDRVASTITGNMMDEVF